MTAHRRISPGCDEWPSCLNETGSIEPIRTLFVEGLPLRPGERAVAVVGTRRPTRAGEEAARRIARGLAEAGYVVVSGMALGIDQIAHRAALSAGGYTIAVLGCGLDITTYPTRSERIRQAIVRNGSLVSEYPPGTAPYPSQFPERNRIVAALAKGVVVVEGGLKSGALITARHAIDADRTVWAVPGGIQNPRSAAPNYLIRTGQAALITDVSHILEELEPSLVHESRRGSEGDFLPKLSDPEQTVLFALDEIPVSCDRLASHLKVSSGEVALGLARLEARGMVTRRLVGYELSPSGLRAREALLLST